MAMQWSESELKKHGDKDLANSIADVHKKFVKRYPYLKDISLPSVATPESGFEIPIVSEKLYTKVREALEKQGFTFIVTINPKSIRQLADSDATDSLFGYIESSKTMWSNVPPQFEVTIDPNNFKIEGSNNLTIDDQIEKIKKQEAILKVKLPIDVGNVISMLKPPKYASILAQLDFEHQNRRRQVLFTNWSGSTGDQTYSGSNYNSNACVGRRYDSRPLDVESMIRGDKIFAVSVVVLPRKLA